MSQVCPDCGRAFGGVVAFGRHVDRRRDRCRNVRELKARGLRIGTDGVWHRSSPLGAQAVLPGLEARRGSRAVDAPALAPGGGDGLYVAQSGTPQQSRGGSG